MNEFIEWLSAYLGIEKNPTATIIVSLSVFCLGIIINEILKVIGRFRERRVIREIVRRNYLLFKNYLYEQALSLELFESLVTEKGSPNFNVYIRPCSALDNYKEISYSNCFRAFFVGFENIRLWNRIIRIQAFDNLYNTLSTVKIEQEKMFPILGKFQDAAAPVVVRLNASMKQAFEAVGDVHITLTQKTSSENLSAWLQEREKLYNTYFSKSDPSALAEIKNYFISVLSFERRNAQPITEVLNLKQFWNYHHQIEIAINDIETLLTMIKTTKAYCLGISDKFKENGEGLNFYYKPLFNQRLK